MSEITAAMAERRQRLHDEREVPEGHELAAVWTGPHWQIEAGRPCRYARQGVHQCGKQSAASILRGFVRPQWWTYCPDHTYGHWIEDGQVMNWILRVTPGRESLQDAQEGKR